MPPRAKRRAPFPERMPDEEDVQQEIEVDEQARPLEFDEALTWRPGKAIPIAELLRRLKTLYEELHEYEQEDAHRKTLEPKAQELASAQLLGHKDKGVKAHTMLCIVEMFRILAPDAPYKGSQLKEIFTLFSSQIVLALAQPSDPYNYQHVSILQSLTTIKSIVLLTDVPGSDNLILNLFTNCFDVMSGNGRASADERLPKNLEYHMTNMLIILVEESETLPNGVIDTILAQFLRADPNAVPQSSLQKSNQPPPIISELSPAYSMSRTVCNATGEKMARAIGNYFSSVLIDANDFATSKRPRKVAGKKRTYSESEDEDMDDGLPTAPDESDLEEVDKAHRLLRELWRSCPDVIINIVPQIEVELAGENAHLRKMAVETVGDMIAGVGAAGPPPALPLDPVAFPSQSSSTFVPPRRSPNVLLDPAAPHAFSSLYPEAYKQFMSRYNDRAPPVRAAWATSAARIIYTSGGGKGLDEDQEQSLLSSFGSMLREDGDERVRLEAIKAVGSFDFASLMQKMVNNHDSSHADGIIAHLLTRVKDVKPSVRAAAIGLVARIWGVASGGIAEGNEQLREYFGAIPSRILQAFTVERTVRLHIHHAMFEYLLPFTYPPIKPAQASSSQRIGDSQTSQDKPIDPDAIRAERILVLVRDLEMSAEPSSAKEIFFGLLSRRTETAKYVERYLGLCEQRNAEDGGSKESAQNLEKMIGFLSKGLQIFPDEQVAHDHLEKFAKTHDRRSFQLIRFCYAPESDYRKVVKATKELTKRLEDAPSGASAVSETILPLARAASSLVYNRSHVPAIVELSRTDENGLAAPAHEILKAMSTKAPEIFKIHVLELCETLKRHTPSAGSTQDPAVVDTLKACAGFARNFSKDMPKDREFYRSMVAYAVNGSQPKAAKHAVTVIVSSAEKKQMYIKDVLKHCTKDFEYGQGAFLSKVAALSQLKLLAYEECKEYNDEILQIAINHTLGHVRRPSDEDEPSWEDSIDDELSAKLWSLRILVNGLRGVGLETDMHETEVADGASKVYSLLTKLVEEDGELAKKGSTPAHHKSRLCLAAATHILKLSSDHRFDTCFGQKHFNQLTKIVQNPVEQVRAGFNKALKKYLTPKAPNKRYLPLVFLYAFEPNKDVKTSTETWLKGITVGCAQRNESTMEACFTRFPHLLAHHQDFIPESTELEDFVEYIVFYLKHAATKENLPLIHQLAQKHKTVQDRIEPLCSENIYILADISQVVIRQFAEIRQWALPVLPAKVTLSSALFQKLPNRDVAQQIAQTNYIPEELADNLEDLVKKFMKDKSKKRKSNEKSAQASKVRKTAKTSTTKKAASKTVKPPKISKKAEDSTIDRRKSTRTSSARNYAENDDSEDDEQLEQEQVADDVDEEEEEEAQEEDREANKENLESETPPTSDPAPAQEEESPPPRKRAPPNRPKRATRKPPAKAASNSRAKRKDVIDVDSDSDGVLSEPPSDMET